MIALQTRFADLLQRYIRKLRVTGEKATGCAPCHEDRNPSFSADLTKCVWFCHACGQGGGVKQLAALVGEPWESPQCESRTVKARRARFRAEQQARAILDRRAEERDKQLCAERREVYGEVVALADLLALFHRRPDLADEFNDVLQQTEREYSEVLFQLSVVEARLDGEEVENDNRSARN